MILIEITSDQLSWMIGNALTPAFLARAGEGAMYQGMFMMEITPGERSYFAGKAHNAMNNLYDMCGGNAWLDPRYVRYEGLTQALHVTCAD